jgi:predicted transglutaminase-like cysteine proteinase
MLVRIAGALALAGLIALGVAGTGAAGDASSKSGAATSGLPSQAMQLAPIYNAENGRAKPPMGWLAFCERYQAECVRETFKSQAIVYDRATRELVQRVNASVNGAITPATDPEQWGIEERWDFAETGVGDCEDYVLLKQRWLVSAGLPPSALLITVVTDLAGDGHAVLTVHTDRGDFILDNMLDEVKLWRETPYGFVKRQSRNEATQWVSLNGGGAPAAMVSR